MNREGSHHIGKWYLNQMPMILLVEPREAGTYLQRQKNYAIKENSCERIVETACALVWLELTD
jgi:hypothetical protein